MRRALTTGPSSAGADRLHDVVALPPALEEDWNELGRMLAVGVHDDDRLAARREESRQDGRLMSEVPREAKPSYFWLDCRSTWICFHVPSVLPSSTIRTRCR